MIWSSPTSLQNCYFCMTNVAGFTSSIRNKIEYVNFSSAFKPHRIEVVDEIVALEEMEVEQKKKQKLEKFLKINIPRL